MSSSVVTHIAEDFDSFYQAHFRNTVRMTYGLTADLPEAHDIAQEAFCRAWSRWRELSGFDNPAAWVRKVAVNLARSRWRRLRVAAEYLVRERPEDVAALDPDHVAVVTALRKLPAAQREAIVLHYLVDLPLAEVAEQMRVPVGTVKSWLHRGRSALAEDLRVDLAGAIVPPGTEQVFKTIKKRQRVRTTAALVVLMMLTTGVIALSRTLGGGPSPTPIESPTPAPSPSSTVDPMALVDWTRATVTFDVESPSCPRGPVTFGPVEGGAGRLSTYPTVIFQSHLVAVGDLDGDGRAEAVLPAFCHANPNSEDQSQRLFVVKRSPDGTLTAIDGADGRRNLALHVWFEGNVFFVDPIPRDSVGGRRHIGETENWRWDGRALQLIDEIRPYPEIGVLNLSPVAARLPCRPQTSDLIAGFGNDRQARAGGRVLSIMPSVHKQVYTNLGRQGAPYLVLGIGCGTASPDETLSIVILDHIEGQWRALGLLPGLRPGDDEWDVTHDRITIGGISHTWDGSAFVRTG